jgi:predicted XRE-type DNA-binding protein
VPPRVKALTTETFDPRLLEEEDAGPKEPVVLDFSPTARHELQGLFHRAMQGTLPRIRTLKEWEPDKLNARHIQMIMMRAGGMPQNAIAEILDVTEGNVSVVLNHPDSQFLLTKVLSYAAESVTDIPARVKAHAGEALDVALHWMRHGSDRVASGNAFKILAMAGYGEEQKTTIRHEVTMPKEQASLLTQALSESRDITPLVRVVNGPGDAPSGTATEGSSPEPGSAVGLPSSLPQDQPFRAGESS